MRRVLIPIVLLLPLLLCSCWDKIELENRGFVISLGIDKYKKGEDAATFEDNAQKNRFTVLMALPNVGALLGTGGKEESKSVKKAANETVSAAMRLIDSYSSQKLYFGQTKVVVLGEELLMDQNLLREAVDALERNRELSRKIIILSSKNSVEDVLKSSAPGEPLMGLFVSDFYKNNLSSAEMAFRQDLESMTRQLRFSGDVLIPQISLEGDGEKKDIKLGGTAVIKNYELVGWLDDKQTRGYLWAKENGKGAQVVAEYDNTFIPLRVNKNKAKISLYEENGTIVCHMDIKVKGVIEEYIFANSKISEPQELKALSKVYEDLVRSEVESIFNCFQNEFAVDGFSLQEELRKKNYALYLKNADDFESAFQKMKLTTSVDVEITSTGVIK